MDITKYLHLISQGEIPPESPDSTKDFFGDTIQCHDKNYHTNYRTTCAEQGLWTVIDMIWTKELALWIGNRSVLEIMAGGGWIAKALTTHNVNIVATDDFSWAKQDEDSGPIHKYPPVFPVQEIEAIKAVKKINKDILLVSWPPCEDSEIINACKIWGEKRPIIYIGENSEGCNAPEEFFKHFHSISPHPKFSFKQWWGIHDKIMIGHWINRKISKTKRNNIY